MGIIQSGRRKLQSLDMSGAVRNVLSMINPDMHTALYRLMGIIHFALVILAGLYILCSILFWLGNVIVKDPSSLLRFGGELVRNRNNLILLAAYIVFDLVRLPFLWRSTISLGFLVVFFTLLINDPNSAPLPALLVACLGSSISEMLNGMRSKPRLRWSVTFQRALFYAGHHAVAALGASIAYRFVFEHVGNPWSHVIPLEAGLAYVAVYSLVSMLLIWPHDVQISLCLIPGVEQFVRVDFLTTALLLPIPALLLYLYSLSREQTGRLFIVVGVLPFLFILLFWLARSFVKMATEYDQLTLHEKAEKRLGPSVNMADMAERMLQAVRGLVDYRWGAVYGQIDEKKDKFELKWCGITIPGSSQVAQESDAGVDQDTVRWPQQFQRGEGILGELVHEHLPPQFFTNGLVPAAVSDMCLPRGTALLGFPITAHVQKEKGAASSIANAPGGTGATADKHQEEKEAPRQPVGWVFLVRSREPFTNRNWEEGQALGREAGNLFRGMQQVENMARVILAGIEKDIENPEKVQLWMQELIKQNIEVYKILEMVRKHWLRDHLRTVLQSMVEGKARERIPVTRETLEGIYEQVRQATVALVMPKSNDQIVDRLQHITASLPLAFSLGHQPVDAVSNPTIKQYYSFALDALDANSISRIVALDSRIASTLITLDSQMAYLDSKVTDLKDKIVGLKSQGTPLDSQITALSSQLTSVDSVRQTTGDAIKVVRRLRDIVQPLQEYSTKEDTTARRACLSLALDMLEGHSKTVQDTDVLRDSERLIFTEILSVWRMAITNTLEELAHGPADLHVRLRSQQVLLLDEITVGLELQNIGPGDASDVVVQLEPSPDYEMLVGAVIVDKLGAGKSVTPDLILRAKARDALRLQFRITYNDPERVGKVMQFADLVYLRASPARFKEIPNPYTPGPPLKPGNPTFFGRDDVRRTIERSLPTLGQRMILVLVGERRTGKTSILQQLPVWLSNQRYIPVYVDCQGLGIDPGMASFFFSLAAAIADGMGKAGFPIQCPPLAELASSPQSVFDRRFLPEVRARIGDYSLLLAVDEFEELEERVKSGSLPPEVFPYLRHLAQHEERLSFIFAGKHEIEDMVGDYWSVLFNIAKYHRFGSLDEQSAIQLITEPVKPYGMVYDDLAIKEILRLTACHPFFTQLICDILVERCNRDCRSYVTVRHVRDALGELVDRGRAHYDFIWRASSREARLVLAALADLQDRLGDVTEAAISSRLGSYQIHLDPGQVTKVMEQLVARDIVQVISRTRMSYGFTAQMYGHWLRRCKLLGKVVEEVGSEPITK
jgi:hypothetical protein